MFKYVVILLIDLLGIVVCKSDVCFKHEFKYDIILLIDLLGLVVRKSMN